MRSRIGPLVLSALLVCAPLAPALAQEDDLDDEYAAEEEGDEVVEEPRSLKTAAEDLGMFGIAFTTVTGMADLLVLRPVVLGVQAVSALTYVFAVGPTALTNPDGVGPLTQSLLVDPALFVFTRPLGGPLDSRAGARPQDDDSVF